MKKATVTKVFTLFLCLLGTVFSTSAQHSIEGHWEGTMIREGAQLPVSFDFINEDAGLKVSFNSPTQRALGIPIRNISFVAPKIHFELIGDTTTIVFDGDLSGGIIAGQFQENTAKGTFSLQRVTAKPPVFKQEEVSFRNRDVILSGTLLIPLTDGPHPVVVFLHGSGSEGRHASRFLAEYLTGRGIAALIYDKRGVGKSTGDWKLSDFNDLAADAMAGIDLVRGRKEINAHKIGLYGHSQGGMLAPLVASRSKDVAFVISAAGSAVPLYEAEVNSIVNQVRDQGVSGSDLADATLFIKIFVDVLRTGKGWEQFETATEKARNAKWYPMLHVPAKDNWFWAFYARIANYNAADYWAKISVPVLVIYGERDQFVPIAKSISNIDRALNQVGNKDYTILILPRASHALNVSPEAGQPFEWSRLSSGFPDLLAAWIRARRRDE